MYIEYKREGRSRQKKTHRTTLIYKLQRVHVEVVPWHISAPDPALLVLFGRGVLWTEGLLNNAHRSFAQGCGFVDLALCGGGDALDQKRKVNLSWNAHSSAIHHHPQQHWWRVNNRLNDTFITSPCSSKARPDGASSTAGSTAQNRLNSSHNNPPSSSTARPGC